MHANVLAMKSSKSAGSCGSAPTTPTLTLKPKSRPLLDCLHNWRRTTVSVDSRPTTKMYLPLTLKPKLAVRLASIFALRLCVHPSNLASLANSCSSRG